ncbi:MAG: hypothetical protein C0404_02375 [Verrucomicrobia bacterium]|nr:hypothetical protein [Verrucomicrobiota bacterium]
MTAASILKVILHETFGKHNIRRQTEPDLVMKEESSVSAYVAAGREIDVMKPVYLFHAAQISEILKPGDTAIDLACGPATLLCMVAGMNPSVKFIGFDLSEEMLGYARQYAAECGLKNIEFRHSDITKLESLGDASVDAVFSTLALHHLPDEEHLDKVFAEVARVLRPDGGVYLLDFGLLKTDAAIRLFAYQYAHCQPEVFTIDYYNSLLAAFPSECFDRLARKHLAGRAKTFFAFPGPYNVAVKSPARNTVNGRVVTLLAGYAVALQGSQASDLKGLRISFGLGGLKSSLLDQALAGRKLTESAGGATVAEGIEPVGV